jgi:hypothetical protein
VKLTGVHGAQSKVAPGAQIGLAAREVVDAAPFYEGLLLGGVLGAETNRLLMDRRISSPGSG